MASGLPWGVQQGWEEAHWLCGSLLQPESGQERRPGVDRAELHKDPIVYFI